jgi:hypothetical protein
MESYVLYKTFIFFNKFNGLSFYFHNVSFKFPY